MVSEVVSQPRAPFFSGPVHINTYMCPVPPKTLVELILKLPLKTALKRNLLFPTVGITYVYLGRNIYITAARKVIQPIGNYSTETMSPLSPS